jgi:hypothetical protein
MKITNLTSRHPEFKFDFMFTGDGDHRKELLITIPFIELGLGFDW